MKSRDDVILWLRRRRRGEGKGAKIGKSWGTIDKKHSGENDGRNRCIKFNENWVKRRKRGLLGSKKGLKVDEKRKYVEL